MTNSFEDRLSKELNKTTYHLTSYKVAQIVKACRQLFLEMVDEACGEEESIQAVHKYFKKLEEQKEKTKNVHPTTAYDYTGGIVNGRNQLRQEIKQRAREIIK